MRKVFAGMAALAALALAPMAAQADGTDSASGVRLFMGASAGEARAVTTEERGVRVHRGAAADALDEALDGALEGGGAAPAAPETIVKVVVVNRYHSKIRHLRTQGFYAGRPETSRRFTQGFYSGPVDKGRRATVVRVKKD